MNTSPTLTKPIPVNTTPLDARSRDLRRQIIRTIEAGKRGHVGSSLSLVEMLRVLYDDVLRYDPARPRWPERDRCILSKGHGCLALYVLLAEKGFFPEAELWKFCQSDGLLGGHPEYGKAPGIEASTGSLGHGLAIGIGLALNARIARAAYHTYVVISDGESQEGSVWEAALCAAKHRLTNLTALVDYNKQQSYSTTYEVLDLDPLADKWRAFGWDVAEVDGHDVAQIRAALLEHAWADAKPRLLICHTIKGKGIPIAENNLQWHHKSKITPEDLAALRAGLGE